MTREYGRKHTDGSRSGGQPPEGTREAAMVTIKDGVWCDPEIVDLVTALNPVESAMHFLRRKQVTQGTDSGLADEACPTCEQTNAAFVCSNGFHRPFGTDRKAVLEEAAQVAESAMLPCSLGGDLILDGFTAETIAQAIRARAEGAGK